MTTPETPIEKLLGELKRKRSNSSAGSWTESPADKEDPRCFVNNEKNWIFECRREEDMEFVVHSRNSSEFLELIVREAVGAVEFASMHIGGNYIREKMNEALSRINEIALKSLGEKK